MGKIAVQKRVRNQLPWPKLTERNRCVTNRPQAHPVDQRLVGFRDDLGHEKEPIQNQEILDYRWEDRKAGRRLIGALIHTNKSDETGSGRVQIPASDRLVLFSFTEDPGENLKQIPPFLQ